MFARLRTKLTVLYAGLFGVAMALTAVAVYLAMAANAERVVRDQLAASGAVFDRLWTMRSGELQAGADLLSRDFGFREAVASHDAVTTQSALENLRQRSGIDLAFIVGVDGRVTVSDGRELGPDGAAIARAVQSDQSGQVPGGVATLGGAPYQAIATPILAPTLTGWVVFAQKLDKREMSSLERLSAIPLTATVLNRSANGRWADLESPGSASNAALSAFVEQTLAGQWGVRKLDVGAGAAIALVKPLKTLAGQPPAVLLLRYPLARALAPYQPLLEILLAIGLAGMGLAVGGSWALARSVTRPVSALDAAVHGLQRGEAARVAVGSRDEIGRLAESFNAMAASIGERERQITHLAMHDPETDLPNRLALEKRLGELEQEGGRGVTAVAALAIDRFADVRGVIGYELAGALVREVAQRIATRIPRAVIGRLSSDTLGMIFQARDMDAARAGAAAIQAALETPVRLGEATADVSITIGLAEAGHPRNGARSPFVCAAIAVGQARKARQKLAVFDPEAYGDPAANLSLMSEMLRGIERGQLLVFHQPKYDIRKGAVSGVEALVRWRHPQRGLLSPDMFIPLAEETGHIRALTDCVLSQAIEHQAAMRLAGHELDMSVNISGRLLSDPEFADAALAMTAKAEGEIRFEVTETAVIDDPERALRHIERFAQGGIGVSIDDYGSGLSSLAYLKQIKAEELKIDKAFVLGVADSRKDALLVRSTIDLAHSLGLKVTAEGVETHEAFSLLAGMGCDFAQGFLIERPMPLKDILTFLHQDRRERRRYG